MDSQAYWQNAAKRFKIRKGSAEAWLSWFGAPSRCNIRGAAYMVEKSFC